MDSLLQPPSATAFDAISSLLCAALYLVVAAAALTRAPSDRRTRVFLAVAVAGIAPYSVTALIWRDGASAALSKPLIAAVLLSLVLGSLALLHFTQIFPWRRPWIRRHAAWLWRGYAAAIVLAVIAFFVTPTFDLAGAGAGGLGAISAGAAEVLVVVALLILVPGLLLVGVVIPFAGLMSLYKTWQLAGACGVAGARTTTLWMLVSQMAGGVLTILVIPLLRLVAPTGPWVTMAAALLSACSLLMPLAFAAGVWRYRILDLDIESPPQ